MKDLKQGDRLQVNENVLQEFQGLMNIVKDKMELGISQEENKFLNLFLLLLLLKDSLFSLDGIRKKVPMDNE